VHLSEDGRCKDRLVAEDRGTFHVYHREERIGSLVFRSSTDGRYEGTTTLTLGDAKTRSTLRIEPDERGRWSSVTAESSHGRIIMRRNGSDLTVTFDDHSTTTRIGRAAHVQDASAPALITHLLRAFGRLRRKRRFPVCVLPGLSATVVVRRQRRFNWPRRGHVMVVRLFSYESGGSKVWVWVDAGARVLLVSSPQHESAYVRAGHLDLFRHLVLGVPPGRLRPLEILRAVPARMRDGVRLMSTVYLPARQGRYPAILIRTPYGRAAEDLQARFYCRRGFAVVLQHVRGRFQSEGEWHPFVHEGKDGYDTIEWVAAQPWCTGKVAMVGGSYSAWVQWAAAVERPPHLAAVVPAASPSDPFCGMPYEHGVFYMFGALWWLDVTSRNATADPSGAAMLAVSARDWSQLLARLPVVELDKVVLGRQDAVWRRWVRHNSNDRYWRRVGFLDRLQKVTIPVFHQAGSFDPLTTSTIINYRRLRAHGHNDQKLVIGPWTHSGETRTVGGRDFGERAIFDLRQATVRWLEWCLAERDNGVRSEALVHLFVTELNTWYRVSEYPIPGTAFERWYLRPHAGGPESGPGTLERTAPRGRERPADFVYDPAHPTLYGRPLGYACAPASNPRRTYLWKARSRHPVDMLRYETSPFKSTHRFVGPVRLRLRASTSARDTDWHVRLLELDRRGVAVPVAQGRIRARYRKSVSRPRLLKPHAIRDYDIDLGHVGIAVPRGSRLQLEIASAAYPMYSRNLNTGGHNETETRYVTARQKVFHSDTASYLVLPAIPEAIAASERDA
jgi:uncharacterized protein